MSEHKESAQAKKEMLKNIEKLLGSELHKIGRADAFYSPDFDIAFYLKYASKEKGKSKDKVRVWSYFPGNYSLSDQSKTFMVFMLEINTNIFIPFNILIEEADKRGLTPNSDETYKVHINASDINNIFIEEIPDLDLKQCYNQFFLKQRKFTISNSSLDNQTIEKKIPSSLKSSYMEGNIREVLCNQYERDQQARRKCIEIYGFNCNICGFNFQKIYGDYGKNFIHVHHLVQISKIGKDYIVNPEKDLIPLCANCHAIVHRVDPPYTPQEVKESITLLSI